MIRVAGPMRGGEAVADRIARSALFSFRSRPIRPLPSGRGLLQASLRPLQSPGEPLDAEARADLEPRFGFDLSTVRIHHGGEAPRLAARLSARAFTVGTEIVFAAGQYAPRDSAGRRLLAHELAHVVQQSGAGVVAIQRQAASAPSQLEVTTDRIRALIERFHASSDADDRLSIARQILGEVDRLVADPATDPSVRGALSREATAVREQLSRSRRSPLSRAGVAAGATVLVGGGPEEPVGDVAAIFVFLGMLALAYVSSRTQADPREVSEALDRMREALRRPQRQPGPERPPPLPLGPDIVPPRRQAPLHRGNIHVQGDDVETPPNYAWSQPVPATKVQGTAGLALVRGQCTPRQLRDRDQAFVRAQRFIETTLTTAPPPVFRTFQNPEVIRDPRRRTRRVDLEIISGTAFS